MFRTMDDFDFRGKRVLVRIDINAPLVDGRVQDCLRIRESAKTLRELSNDGAGVVVLAHQGRKNGSDYLESLEQHAEILNKYVGKKINYVDDLIGSNALDHIKNLKYGEIILLKNVRSLDEEVDSKTPEEHANGILVKTLSPLFDVFVNDAFSAVHRSHESLVGFIPVLPSCAGRLMEKEYVSISSILKEPKHPFTAVFGGNKPEDVIGVVENLLSRRIVDRILLGGLVGSIFIFVRNGENVDGEYSDEVDEILRKYGDKIFLPLDLAFEENGKRVEIDTDNLSNDRSFFDIGEKTIKLFEEEISKSLTIVMKGPMGMFEDKNFSKGTKKVLEAIANSSGFTVLGGGHTSSLPEVFRIPLEKFSHVSVAGGAFIRLLSGEKLPVIEALKKYCN